MIKWNIRYSLLSLLMLFSHSAWSENWALGVYLESLEVNPLPAFQQGVGDSALALGIEAAYEPEHWQIGLGLSFISFDDKNPFSQTVEGVGLFNDGDISTESSDASGIILYVDAGPQLKLLDNALELTAKVGAGYLNADRSIPSCTNCYEESIDLDIGSYVRLMAAYRFDWGGISLGFTNYLNDDFDNSVLLMIKIGQ